MPNYPTICLMSGLAVGLLFFPACDSPESTQPRESAWKSHHQAGASSLEQGHYPEAEKQFQAALKEVEGFAETDARRLRTLAGLARLRVLQGQHTQAESLYLHILTLREKSLGTENPRLASTLEELAAIYSAQEKLERTENLYRRILELQENNLDPASASSTLSKLADLYRKQNNFARADSLSRRAMGLKLHTRAYDHYLQKKYDPAEKLYKRALKIQQKTLGNAHPDLARTYYDLALLYAVQNRYGPAEKLYKRALAVQERLWGDNHRELAPTLDNLAQQLEKLGRPDEAAAMRARARQIRTQ